MAFKICSSIIFNKERPILNSAIEPCTIKLSKTISNNRLLSVRLNMQTNHGIENAEQSKLHSFNFFEIAGSLISIK